MWSRLRLRAASPDGITCSHSCHVPLDIAVLALVGVFTLVAPAPAARAQATTPPATLTLDAAVERALAANPTLAAARLRRPIDAAGVAVARERPNPELHVELARETPKEAYGLAVPLELGGKRTRRIALGEAAVRTGDAEIEVALAAMRAAVRRAYFGALAAETRLALLGELRDLATRMREAARQRFDSGSAPRLEVLQADLSLAQAENELGAAAAAARGARVRLNTLLAWPADAAPGLVTAMDQGTVPSLDAALARARTTSAELTALSRRVDEQQARLALARALRVPDVTPEFTVTRRAEPEFTVGWRAAVSIAVPLFSRHDAAIHVEQATLAAVAAERDAATATVAGEVTAAVSAAVAQRDQYRRYRDRILPQAVEVEHMADDSYRLGQTGLAAYLQALQISRDARLRSVQAALDYQSALADLEQAMGAPLP